MIWWIAVVRFTDFSDVYTDMISGRLREQSLGMAPSLRFWRDWRLHGRSEWRTNAAAAALARNGTAVEARVRSNCVSRRLRFLAGIFLEMLKPVSITRFNASLAVLFGIY
jgi:hypothetical protein